MFYERSDSEDFLHQKSCWGKAHTLSGEICQEASSTVSSGSSLQKALHIPANRKQTLLALCVILFLSNAAPHWHPLCIFKEVTKLFVCSLWSKIHTDDSLLITLLIAKDSAWDAGGGRSVQSLRVSHDGGADCDGDYFRLIFLLYV